MSTRAALLIAASILPLLATGSADAQREQRQLIRPAAPLGLAAPGGRAGGVDTPDLVVQVPAGNTSPYAGTPEWQFCGDNGPQGGASTSIQYQVRNQGGALAGPTQSCAQFGNGSMVCSNIPSLVPNGGMTVDLPIPDGCYPPYFSSVCTFYISVDAASQIAEASEANNSADSYCQQPAG